MCPSSFPRWWQWLLLLLFHFNRSSPVLGRISGNEIAQVDQDIDPLLAMSAEEDVDVVDPGFVEDHLDYLGSYDDSHEERTKKSAQSPVCFQNPCLQRLRIPSLPPLPRINGNPISVTVLGRPGVPPMSIQVDQNRNSNDQRMGQFVNNGQQFGPPPSVPPGLPVQERNNAAPLPEQAEEPVQKDFVAPHPPQPNADLPRKEVLPQHSPVVPPPSVHHEPPQHQHSPPPPQHHQPPPEQNHHFHYQPHSQQAGFQSHNVHQHSPHSSPPQQLNHNSHTQPPQQQYSPPTAPRPQPHSPQYQNKEVHYPPSPPAHQEIKQSPSSDPNPFYPTKPQQSPQSSAHQNHHPSQSNYSPPPPPPPPSPPQPSYAPPTSYSQTQPIIDQYHQSKIDSKGHSAPVHQQPAHLNNYPHPIPIESPYQVPPATHPAHHSTPPVYSSPPPPQTNYSPPSYSPSSSSQTNYPTNNSPPSYSPASPSTNYPSDQYVPVQDHPQHSHPYSAPPPPSSAPQYSSASPPTNSPPQSYPSSAPPTNPPPQSYPSSSAPQTNPHPQYSSPPPHSPITYKSVYGDTSAYREATKAPEITTTEQPTTTPSPPTTTPNPPTQPRNNEEEEQIVATNPGPIHFFQDIQPVDTEANEMEFRSREEQQKEKESKRLAEEKLFERTQSYQLGTNGHDEQHFERAGGFYPHHPEAYHSPHGAHLPVPMNNYHGEGHHQAHAPCCGNTFNFYQAPALPPSYDQPAYYPPSIPCSENLIFSCAPTVQEAPCQSYGQSGGYHEYFPAPHSYEMIPQQGPYHVPLIHHHQAPLPQLQPYQPPPQLEYRSKEPVRYKPAPETVTNSDAETRANEKEEEESPLEDQQQTAEDSARDAQVVDDQQPVDERNQVFDFGETPEVINANVKELKKTTTPTPFIPTTTTPLPPAPIPAPATQRPSPLLPLNWNLIPKQEPSKERKGMDLLDGLKNILQRGKLSPGNAAQAAAPAPAEGGQIH